jgi:NH3-dependent NAD+ synthetase
LSSSFEKYMEILKLQATTAATVEEAQSAIESMEIYGYKAVPVIRDIMETATNARVKKLCTVALRNAGWLP